MPSVGSNQKIQSFSTSTTHLSLSIRLVSPRSLADSTWSDILLARISDANGWKDGLEKARAFVAELTLQEKADMVTGQPGPCVGNIYPIPRLNFGGLCLQDGPASLRTADLVSAFPGGVTIASSWDKDMMYARSVAMGSEFRAKGAQIALA